VVTSKTHYQFSSVSYQKLQILQFKHAASHQHWKEQADTATCHRPLHLLARRCGSHSSRITSSQVGCAWLTGHNPSHPKLCYGDTYAASSHSSRLSSFCASFTKLNKCIIFSFVHKILGREGIWSTLLVNAGLNIEETISWPHNNLSWR